MIKILLADDQYLMLEGIKSILKHESEIEVVGTAQDGQTAIAQVKKLQPDIVLIDIEMPKMNGIVATKYICESMPDTRVIILTSHNDQNYITQALQAGASGYLLKNSLIEDLKQAIYSLGRGYSYIEAKLLIKAVDKVQRTNVIRYQEKISYIKKHRKSIYNPTYSKKIQQLFSKTSNRQLISLGMRKASFAPRFKPQTTHNLTANRKSTLPSVYSPPSFNRRKYLRRIIWLLFAIASFTLSIIIF